MDLKAFLVDYVGSEGTPGVAMQFAESKDRLLERSKERGGLEWHGAKIVRVSRHLTKEEILAKTEGGGYGCFPTEED